MQSSVQINTVKQKRDGVIVFNVAVEYTFILQLLNDKLIQK